jgi:hypothetical protein
MPGTVTQVPVRAANTQFLLKLQLNPPAPPAPIPFKKDTFILDLLGYLTLYTGTP